LKDDKKKIQKEWIKRDKNLQDREDSYYKIFKFTKDQEDKGYDRAMSRTYGFAQNKTNTSTLSQVNTRKSSEKKIGEKINA
jgi:hypothetical protein